MFNSHNLRNSESTRMTTYETKTSINFSHGDIKKIFIKSKKTTKKFINDKPIKEESNNNKNKSILKNNSNNLNRNKNVIFADEYSNRKLAEVIIIPSYKLLNKNIYKCSESDNKVKEGISCKCSCFIF